MAESDDDAIESIGSDHSFTLVEPRTSAAFAASPDDNSLSVPLSDLRRKDEQKAAATQQSKGSGRQMTSFVNGSGIDREVITTDIYRFLGNDALVKPGTYQETEGYFITAYRHLTFEQLRDIKNESANWQEEKQRNRGLTGVSQRNLNPQSRVSTQLSGGYNTSDVNEKLLGKPELHQPSQPQQGSYRPLSLATYQSMSRNYDRYPTPGQTSLPDSDILQTSYYCSFVPNLLPNLETHNYFDVRIPAEDRAGVKAVDKDGRMPLHDAARAGSMNAIRTLIINRADVKAVDKDGRTPLHDAARAGSEEAIWWLVMEGADVKAIDKDGRTALHYSAGASSEDTILKILSTTNQGLVKYNGNISWGGLETYKTCEGAISDILTISRLNFQGHCYVARSVLEFLSEYYPALGIQILNWITRICKNCRELENSTILEESFGTTSHISQNKRQKLTESKAASRRMSKDFSPVREVIVKDSIYATLNGHLEATQLAWVISTTSEELALDIKSALTWTLSVLQSRPQDAEGLFVWTPVSLDIGLPEITRFEPTRAESYCWTNLFNYACIAHIPLLHYPYHSTTEGLEIDFSLLLELAAVDREIATEDGFIFFGFDTALIPLELLDSRRWHYLVTNGRQITPARMEKALKEFGDIRYKGKIGPDYCSGNVYVGWCAAPLVEIGTIHSDKVPIDDISMSSGVHNVKKREESVERTSGYDMSLHVRIGFLGSSIGPSGGMKREKKLKQVTVVAKRSQKDNFEGVLTSARATPCILWDQSGQKGWLVSAVSALLFASLRHAKWKRYSFKSMQADGQFGPVTDYHAAESTNTTSSSETALRKCQMYLVDEVNGGTMNNQISFEDIVMLMWSAMSCGEDACFSGETGSKYEEKESLLGYDLNEAVCFKGRIYQRSLKVSLCMRSWQPLVYVKDPQVIFCKDIGGVVKCKSPTASDDCCTRNCPKGSLSCLVEDLRAFYGECWDTPSDLHVRSSRLGALPIGYNHEWIPSGCESLLGQDTRLCSRSLQSIVARKQQMMKLQEKLQKKLQKKKLQMEECQTENGTPSLLFSLRSVPTLVTFGSS